MGRGGGGMRSLSVSSFWERGFGGGGGMRSLSLSVGWELCGGVAAPDRLESMLLVEARAAAAVGVSSRGCDCGRGGLVVGFGECVGSLSMSLSIASGSGRTDFDNALLSSTSKAFK